MRHHRGRDSGADGRQRLDLRRAPGREVCCQQRDRNHRSCCGRKYRRVKMTGIHQPGGQKACGERGQGQAADDADGGQHGATDKKRPTAARIVAIPAKMASRNAATRQGAPDTFDISHGQARIDRGDFPPNHRRHVLGSCPGHIRPVSVSLIPAFEIGFGDRRELARGCASGGGRRESRERRISNSVAGPS